MNSFFGMAVLSVMGGPDFGMAECGSERAFYRKSAGRATRAGQGLQSLP